MEYCEKILNIMFFLVFIISAVLEIIFLFQVPYYYYSYLLKSLKIIRILLGMINLLINLYFTVINYAENLIKKEEGYEGNPPNSRIYHLSDKITIIIAFIISTFTLCFNLVGLGSCSKYLKNTAQNNIYIDSLLFLIENILVTICWIYFFIYWGFIIKFSMIPKTKIKPKKVDKDAPPLPSIQQQPSSERNVKNNEINENI